MCMLGEYECMPECLQCCYGIGHCLQGDSKPITQKILCFLYKQVVPNLLGFCVAIVYICICAL